jgi:glyoxylase-like metal-dependent hydrolase (beta-lactamase superfamily II)
MSSATEVAPGIHRIELGFVNAYLIENDGELSLFDSGFPGDEPTIVAAIESLGRRPNELRRVILSHGHIDHFGSAVAVRELTGAPLLLSQVDADRLASGWAGHAPMQVQEGFEELVRQQLSDPDFRAKTGGRDTSVPCQIEPIVVDAHLIPGSPVDGLPDSELIAAPGHCKGQLALLLKRDGGVLLTGDAAVNFGGVAIAPVGEDLELSKRTFAQLAERDFEVAAFGHGEPLTDGAADAFRAGVARAPA